MNCRPGPITKLPEELIVNIFSYLPLKDLLNASLVCSNWNEVSKYPILWQKVKAQISEEKVLIFCKFMSTIRLVEVFWFQITWSQDYYYFKKKPTIAPEIQDAINNMILGWPTLRCLCISRDILLRVFPNSLKHISYIPVHPPYHNVDLIDDKTISLISTLKHVDEIRICHVHLARYTDKSLVVLLSSQALLKCLVMDCYSLKKESLNLIGSLSHLTRLSLSNCLSLDETCLTGIVRLKHLKCLSLEEVCDFSKIMCNALEFHSFCCLEYLLLSQCETITKRCFVGMNKKISNLLTFGINSCVVMKEDILMFLSASKNVKTIAFDASISDFTLFLQEIADLHSFRNFNSICFCDIGYAFDNDTYNQHRMFIENHFKCSKCLFKYPNQYFVCDCF